MGKQTKESIIIKTSQLDREEQTNRKNKISFWWTWIKTQEKRLLTENYWGRQEESRIKTEIAKNINWEEWREEDTNDRHIWEIDRPAQEKVGTTKKIQVGFEEQPMDDWKIDQEGSSKLRKIFGKHICRIKQRRSDALDEEPGNFCS